MHFPSSLLSLLLLLFILIVLYLPFFLSDCFQNQVHGGSCTGTLGHLRLVDIHRSLCVLRVGESLMMQMYACLQEWISLQLKKLDS